MVTAHLLAYAESHDNPNAILLLILESLGLLVVVVVVAIVPLMVARSRKHGGVDMILTGCVVWAFVTAGDALYLLFARYRWSKEYNTLVLSGYYDPSNTSTAPSPHWLFWGLLAAAYIALTIYAAAGRTAPPTADPSSPIVSINGHPKKQ